MQGAVESRYCRCVPVAKLVRCLPEAHPFVKKTNDKEPRSRSARAYDALGAICLHSAVLFRAQERDVLLYIDSPAAHTAGRRRSCSLI